MQIRTDHIEIDADDFKRMLINIRRLLPMYMAKDMNWVFVRDVYGLGSTSAIELCKKFGVDPDSNIV